MAIYYSILYPPRVPLDLPAFELKQPSDTWRLYLEPSVGNRPSDFKGGFIRIRNSETERNVLFPGSGGYYTEFLPFRNPFAEFIDLKNPSRSTLQPPGFNPTIPVLQQNERGEFYIDIRHEVFLMSGAPKDIKYKVQVMFTSDWISSSLDNGKGYIQTWDKTTNRYENIDKNLYFGGNLIQKGLSEWSTITRVAPVSTANYELQFDKGVIFSPIYEFVGSSIEENLRNNNIGNFLKAYRINIYRAFGSEKELFVDSSDWIVGQDSSNLEIRWQNKVELEDNKKYIIELDIQTVWNLRKTFIYHIETSFESSIFRGNVRIENDHDYARNKIIIKAETPLTWGPKNNFSIDPFHFDYAKITGTAYVEQGIDLYSKEGKIAGEMLLTGIDPVNTLEIPENNYIFRLVGPELSIHNPIQEEYTIYAHSLPLGPESDDGRPFVDDIVINPVIESISGETYQVYLDSQIQKSGLGMADNISGSVATLKTNIPSSHSFFYLEDESGQMWKTTVTVNGEFTTEPSHEKDPGEYLRPVGFYDGFRQILAMPTVTTKGNIEFKEENVYHDYNLAKYVKPMYINEFKLIKNVYALELGRKTKIMSQEYKSYLTDYNRKLGDWEPISKSGEYYIYFSSVDGQVRLIVRHVNAKEGSRALDRFTSSYMEGTIAMSNLGDGMYVVTEGIKPDFLPVRNVTGEKIPYVITIDERGVLVAEEAYIAAATSRANDYIKKRKGV